MEIDLKAYRIKTIGDFRIYRTRAKDFDRQYIIWNTTLPFKNGHTHRFTLGECESIVQNILNGVEPKRRTGWKKFNDLLISHIRLSTAEEYINHTINLANAKGRITCQSEVKRSCLNLAIK